VEFQRGRGNPDGCFDFQEPAFVKELTDHAKELGSDAQNGPELLQSLG
jgi:hypothetical protein